MSPVVDWRRRGQNTLSIGYIKFMRSEETVELVRRPHEFTLLALISMRARRTCSFSTINLEPGEALIGDFQSCGMTEQKYRTAKRNLEKWGFITTRSTNRGTIAKLENSGIFDINMQEGNEQTNEQATDKQRPIDEPPTSNKNEIMNKNRKKERRSTNDLLTPFQKESFHRFWTAYPRKKSKGQAEKAWESIGPNEELLKRILTALDHANVSTDWLRDGGRYIPYPATWLRAKGWEDEHQSVSLLQSRVSDVTIRNMNILSDWEPGNEK
jgi:hypothetical protein